MRVTHTAGAFVAECPFAEKDIAKEAGFVWTRIVERRWATTEARVAKRLAEYCDDDARAAIEAVLGGGDPSRATTSDIEVPCPDGLGYLPFQKAGIAYARTRQTTLIADEMGLGKTIQALGFINADETIQRVLVICPASLKINWRREANRWIVRPHIVEIATSKHITTGAPDGFLLIAVTNYDILKKVRTEIRSVTWDLLVCDESHYLKNPKAGRTVEVFGQKAWTNPRGEVREAILPVPARRKVYMTGTPIVNRPIELWPLLRSLGGWGGQDDTGGWRGYVERYCDGYEGDHGWVVTGHSNEAELQEKLRERIMVRRLKRDVLKELPPKRRQVIELPANGAGAAVEAEAAAWGRHHDRIEYLQTAVELAKAGEDDEGYRAAVQALRDGHQVAFAETSTVRHAVALAKVPAVVDHAVNMVESVGRLVIFAHHHDVIAGIRAGLAAAKPDAVSSVQLTGEDTMEDRQAAVDAFQGERLAIRGGHLADGGTSAMEPIPGEAPAVFVGSITAAGVGITLTKASHVLFAELDWVPGNITQAEDRTHRIGQTDSVLVQHLVLEGSLDVEMAKRLVEKQTVIDAALDDQKPDAAWGSMLSIGEGATRRDTRAGIAVEALGITAEEITLVHSQLQALSAMCDGAVKRDEQGFNAYDSPLGKRLAAEPWLTPRQAILGRRLVTKYRRQLGMA